MQYEFQFETAEDREAILSANTDKYLIKEQNIIEGSFLIFSDKPLPERVVYTQVPQQEFEGLLARQDATDDMVLQLIMEGLIK